MNTFTVVNKPINMKALLATLVLLMTLLGCGPGEVEPVDMIWTDLAEIQATFPKAHKPLFIYISQNNCEWCQHMDSLVYSRPEVARYLNENYLNININADRDLPVTINNRSYNYRELFHFLKIQAMPAYYFFDTTGKIIGIMDSAMPLRTFKQLLVYVENRHFMRTRWEDFLKLPEADVDTIYGRF